jgi:hypothetical protein
MRSMSRCYKQDKSRVWLVVRESPASKESERGSWGIYDVGSRYQTKTGENSRLRRLSACCSELLSVQIRDSDVVTLSYDL